MKRFQFKLLQFSLHKIRNQIKIVFQKILNQPQSELIVSQIQNIMTTIGNQNNQSDPELQNNFLQLLSNFPVLPCPQNYIERIYQNYVSQLCIQDKQGKLKQKILKANKKSIQQKFISFMNVLFHDLDKHFSSIIKSLNLNIIDQLIQQNLPSCIIETVNQSSKIEKNKKRYKSSIIEDHQQTPSGIDRNISEDKRMDALFNYLLNKFLQILIKFQEYYQLQDIEEIQVAIVNELINYANQNENSFLNVDNEGNRIIQQSKCIGSSKNQKDRFAKIQEQKNEQEQKANQLDNLMDIVVQSIDDKQAIRKINQQSTLSKRKIGSVKLGKYQFSPLEIAGKAYSFIGAVYNKGLPRILANQFYKARNSTIKKSYKKYQITEQQEAKTQNLASIMLKNHLKHNISRQTGLNADQFKMITNYLNSARYQNFLILNNRFNQQEKTMIIQILTETLDQIKAHRIINCHQHIEKLEIFLHEFLELKLKPEAKNKFKSQKSQLRATSSSISSSLHSNQSKKGIKTTLSIVNTVSQLPNKFYFVVILYKIFEKQYSPSIRRLILRIGHQIEERQKRFYQEKLQKQQFDEQLHMYRKFCIVHALKLIQSEKIFRTELCKKVTQQLPYHQSQLPLQNQRHQYYSLLNKNQQKQKNLTFEQAQKYVELQIQNIHIFSLNKVHKPAQIQFLKLTHSTNKKNVTILISGFLSQKTNKFQQWLGVIQPTYDSQIYALKWESNTAQNMFEYVLSCCKDIAFAGIGIVGGPYVKAALVLKAIYNKYNQNPFSPCFQTATITGIYLAELIINLFQGHFVNLVGFSLGTQVIQSTLNQLRKNKKLNMINRVITMGGAADKNEFTQILDNATQNQQRPISIAWTNIYCQTDNILKYLLKLSMPSISPIGVQQIPNQANQEQVNFISNQPAIRENERVYQVDNINVTQFVGGHLYYRSNMRIIARLIGIKDQ